MILKTERIIYPKAEEIEVIHDRGKDGKQEVRIALFIMGNLVGAFTEAEANIIYDKLGFCLCDYNTIKMEESDNAKSGDKSNRG